MVSLRGIKFSENEHPDNKKDNICTPYGRYHRHYTLFCQYDSCYHQWVVQKQDYQKTGAKTNHKMPAAQLDAEWDANKDKSYAGKGL